LCLTHIYRSAVPTKHWLLKQDIKKIMYSQYGCRLTSLFKWQPSQLTSVFSEVIKLVKGASKRGEPQEEKASSRNPTKVDSSLSRRVPRHSPQARLKSYLTIHQSASDLKMIFQKSEYFAKHICAMIQ
jgi:hypothetical protein